MNENSKALSILLHEMRTTPIAPEQFARFTHLLRTSTAEEIAKGTADYVMGLLRVSQSVTAMEKAVAESALAEIRGKLH
jgi:hypothetical protein